MKTRKGFILLIFLACGLRGAAQSLPDFSKSVPNTKGGLVVLQHENTLHMENACEVGNYDFTLYEEKDGIIYRYYSAVMSCPDRKKEGFRDWTDKEIEGAATDFTAPSKGHWYIVTNIHKNQNCGLVFEFHVYEDSISKIEYELPCN